MQSHCSTVNSVFPSKRSEVNVYCVPMNNTISWRNSCSKPSSVCRQHTDGFAVAVQALQLPLAHYTVCSCRASEHRKHWAAENLPNSCHVVCSSLGTVWCRHKWDDLSPSHRDKLAIVCQSHSKVGVCRLWAVSLSRLWGHTHTVHWSYRLSQDISWILLMDIWPLQ